MDNSTRNEMFADFDNGIHIIKFYFVLFLLLLTIYVLTGNNESLIDVTDYTDDLTNLKLRKSQFNLSVSLTPGELSAIFDTTTTHPKLNSEI